VPIAYAAYYYAETWSGPFYLHAGVDPYDYVRMKYSGPSIVVVNNVPLFFIGWRGIIWAEHGPGPVYPAWSFSSYQPSGDMTKGASNAPGSCPYHGGACWDYGWLGIVIWQKGMEVLWYAGPS